MKKEFVTYEIALKLKELGFNEKCLYSIEYSEGGRTLQLNPNFKNNSQCYIGEITIPLWEQVIDFFREKYDIHVSVPNYYDGWKIDIRGFKQNINLGYHSKPGLCLENYYDAREEAILKAIELVQNKPV